MEPRTGIIQNFKKAVGGVLMAAFFVSGGIEDARASLIVPSGSLDSNFNGNGKKITGVAGQGAELFDVVTQSDNKIVAVGFNRTAAGRDFLVARYNEDGSLDTTFGLAGSGLVATDFGGDDMAYAIETTEDGKFLVAGGATLGAGDQRFALARYNPNGQLDPTFGQGGTTTLFVNNTLGFGMMQDHQGRILVTGGQVINGFGGGQGDGLVLARFNEDGMLDTTFGQGGFVERDFSQNEGAGHSGGLSVAVRPDNKIAVAGFGLQGPDFEFTVAVFNDNGTPDLNFGAPGSGGKVVVDFNASDSFATDIHVDQTTGTMRVLGVTTGGTRMFVAKFDSDGDLIAPSSTSLPGLTDTPLMAKTMIPRLLPQSDGKLYIAGSVNGGLTGMNLAIARITADGLMDSSFGVQGVAEGPLSKFDDEARAIALDAQGRIVAAGFAQTAISSSSTSLAVDRFNNDFVPSGGGNGGGGGGVSVAEADLSVVVDQSATAVQVGDKVIFTAVVTNLGPNTSNDVHLTIDSSINAVFSNIATTQGTATTPQIGAPGQVVAELGAIPNGGQATVILTIGIAPADIEVVKLTFSLGSSTVDPNELNSVVTAGLDVKEPAPPQAAQPSITSVAVANSAVFKLKVNGTNFQQGLQVFIGGQPLTNVKFKSANQIILRKGDALLNMFAVGVPTEIRIVNPDGGVAAMEVVRN